MKKYSLLSLSILMTLYSCNNGEIDGYKNALEPGGPVTTILVSPISKTLYADSDLPTLSYVCVPSNAIDTTVTWSSSRPDVLSVDAKTGKLLWETIRNSEVTITATSNSGQQQGYCLFTIKNEMGVYQYLDLREELGLWILDRNLGASKPYEVTDGSDGPNGAKGNYYQWGKNTVVANREFGGSDGKGGYYNYKGDGSMGWRVRGGYPTFDLRWKMEGEEFVDWSTSRNTPCPAGWRLPTKADFEKIIKKTDPNLYTTAADKGAAKLLRAKLALGHTGVMWIPGGLFMEYNGVWWSSDWDPETKKVWCLMAPEVDETRVLKIVQQSYNIGEAIPIRCVKDGISE